MPETPSPTCAVTCHTCGSKVWEGDTAPQDGQVLLTEFADKSCPQGGAGCPNTSAAVAATALARAATVGDVAAIKGRLDKLEKAKP